MGTPPARGARAGCGRPGRSSSSSTTCGVPRLQRVRHGPRATRTPRTSTRAGRATVDFTPYNAPGMLIWYRDSRLLAERRGRPPVRPAEHRRRRDGPDRGLALRPGRTSAGAAAQANPSLLDALPGRQQAATPRSGRSAGTRSGRASRAIRRSTTWSPATVRPARRRAGVHGRASSWYPGFEYRPDLDPDDPLFFRDVDASVVVPSKDNQIYSTRVTDQNGSLLRTCSGRGLGDGTSPARATPPTACRRATTARPAPTRTCPSA